MGHWMWVIGLMLLISSCATKWVKSGVTDLDLKRDRYECLQQASDYVILPLAAGPFAMRTVNGQLYEACMGARGYEKQ